MANDREDPALKDYSPMWESVKHVAGKALKWAAVTALVFGGLALLPSLGIGGLGWLTSWATGASGTAVTLKVLTPILQLGATVGAVFGAVSGVGSLSEALGDAKDNAIADKASRDVAQQRAKLLRGQAQNVASNNVSSGLGGQGRGQQQGVGIGV